MLCNLSSVLPRLLTWGLPTVRLPILDVSCTELVDGTDELFNHLFLVPEIEPLAAVGNIPPWPFPLVEEDAEGDLFLPDDETSVAFHLGAAVGHDSTRSDAGYSVAPVHEAAAEGDTFGLDVGVSVACLNDEAEHQIFRDLSCESE